MMDWLGDIGGIGGLLEFTAMIFFGGYLSFNCSMSTMLSLYDLDDE